MIGIRDIQINIGGISETVRGENRGDNIYYCLESPLFVDSVLYGCEVEVEEINGVLVFQKIHKASLYETYTYVWSKEFLASKKGKEIKERIIEVGGDWEQVMGGLFLIHLPKEKDYTLSEILKIDE